MSRNPSPGEKRKEAPFRSGFVSIIGRPNVGKSTLVNAMLGEKVSITAKSPNTTRTAVRGILSGPGYQAILVDTPGLHKPQSVLGERLNKVATGASSDADVTLFCLDATGPIGRGDRFIAKRVPSDTIVVLNKIDMAPVPQVLLHLQRAEELGLVDAQYFAVSARTGKGVTDLVRHVVERLPFGPSYFPVKTVRDSPDSFFIAELVREQLLRFAREELPHSIACQVTEMDGPYVRCEIVVERDSQRAIILGKKGDLIKATGIAARAQLPPGTYLDLYVRVERDWQRHEQIIEDLGY